MANKKLTDFDLSTSLESGDYLVGYKANATGELRTTFQTVQDSLPDLFKYQGTDLKDLSGNWESVYTLVSSNSAFWEEAYTLIQTNSATWETDSSIDTELRDLSANWDSTFSTVESNSALWVESYTLIQANSATWETDNSIDTELRDLSANWQTAYTLVEANSGAWNEVYTVVQTNSATWEIDNTIDTELRDLSANWDSAFSTVQTNSATNWDNSISLEYSHSNFLPLSGGDLTGAVSLSNVSIEPGQTITECISSLVITINGQQFKVPLLAI